MLLPVVEKKLEKDRVDLTEEMTEEMTAEVVVEIVAVVVETAVAVEEEEDKINVLICKCANMLIASALKE